MKFYPLKYVPTQKHPGMQRMWRITIMERFKGDKGLLAHEVFHVAQWYVCLVLTVCLAAVLGYLVTPELYFIAGAAPWLHHILYRTAPYRRISEGWATRIQLRKGSYGSNVQWAVDWLKGMGMSKKWAKWWTR